MLGNCIVIGMSFVALSVILRRQVSVLAGVVRGVNSRLL